MALSACRQPAVCVRSGPRLCAAPHAARPRQRRVAAAATKERVLRYPDGKERRIIYPEATIDEDEDWEAAPGAAQLWWATAGPPQGVAGAVGQAATSPSVQDTAAFLEGLFAASYQAQPLVDVDHCYQILDGCPWVLPRPVFVLTSQGWGWGASAADGIQSTYTLRTKVNKDGAADALAQLLNKQHLCGALEVAEMRDGVVMFECDADADRFASLLEEEGHSQVLVAEVDSHRAFRMASEVRALVVLLPAGGPMPQPYQLAASLRKARSLEA